MAELITDCEIDMQLNGDRPSRGDPNVWWPTEACTSLVTELSQAVSNRQRLKCDTKGCRTANWDWRTGLFR